MKKNGTILDKYIFSTYLYTINNTLNINTMTNAINFSDRLFSWYQAIRYAQTDMPAEKLVDQIYDRVVSDVHPDEIREYHLELFCQLCNDRDSIMHP